MELPELIPYVLNMVNNISNIYYCYDNQSDGLPELGMNMEQIVRFNGYPIETHKIPTQDGYILTAYRIPRGKNHYNSNATQEPVLVQHGFLSSAYNWVTNYENQSLGYVLADHGYDVWLGNIRGNSFSREHVNYTTNHTEFWNFSWEEMAEYDLPAMVDYILDITKRSQLYYIGYSQGSLMGFAKFSSDPEFSRKVKLFVALAPVATVGDITNPVRFLAPFTWTLKLGFYVGGYNSFGMVKQMLRLVQKHVAEAHGESPCRHLYFQFIIGPQARTNLNKTRLPLYLSRMPDDTSMKNVAHYGQMVASGLMQKYDYGFIENYIRYGQFYPPEYYPEKMTVPTVIFWSAEDNLAGGRDIKKLFQRLKSNKYRTIQIDRFNHIDFLLSLNASQMVYSKILQALKTCC